MDPKRPNALRSKDLNVRNNNGVRQQPQHNHNNSQAAQPQPGLHHGNHQQQRHHRQNSYHQANHINHNNQCGESCRPISSNNHNNTNGVHRQATTNAVQQMNNNHGGGGVARNTNNTFSTVPRTHNEIIEDFNRRMGTYAEDVHETQKQDEEKFWRNRKNCFMIQKEITEQMRSILIDWLSEVTEEYNLCLNTLYLSVNYIDRILEICQIPRSKLQLLGVSCMLVASKFEEIHPPLVDDFVYITDNTYRRDEILQTELVVLNTLKFSLTVCTIKNFLTRFLLISDVWDIRIIHHTNYLAELTLPDYNIHHKYKPSLIAAAITCISKAAFNLPACTPVFEIYAGYSKAEILLCIQDIYSLHSRISSAKLGELTSAREKYRLDKYGGVSQLPLSLDILRM